MYCYHYHHNHHDRKPESCCAIASAALGSNACAINRMTLILRIKRLTQSRLGMYHIQILKSEPDSVMAAPFARHADDVNKVA